jgi:hypothetical protein
MADPKAPPAPDMSNDDDTDQTDAGAPEDTGGEGDSDEGRTVLCTIYKEADGGYCVEEGDEDEDEGEESGEPAAPGAEGADMGEKPEPEVIHEPGQVLKAVLNILNKDQEENGNSAQDNFNAGFNDDEGPTPKKPAAAPKY